MLNPMDWYMQEEEKRRDIGKRNEISLINHNLKRILQEVQIHINKEDYNDVVDEESSILVQTSLWDVGYLNNLENPKVAVAQGVLIHTILKNEKAMQKKPYWLDELTRQMRAISNVDWQAYSSYLEKIQHSGF